MNTLKRYNQLLYCPNKGCGYSMDHVARNCPFVAPWDVARKVAHTVEGASMRGQHKSLADGLGAGMGWIMRGPIAQAQWVVDQRRAYGEKSGGSPRKWRAIQRTQRPQTYQRMRTLLTRREANNSEDNKDNNTCCFYLPDPIESINYYQCLHAFDEEDDETIVTSNCVPNVLSKGDTKRNTHVTSNCVPNNLSRNLSNVFQIGTRYCTYCTIVPGGTYILASTWNFTRHTCWRRARNNKNSIVRHHDGP